MIEILTFLKIGIGVVLLFGAAIFVHEFGHYWVARRCGLKVEAFAIGFGPKIFAWTRDGIEYSVRWIPAGGFVKLPQMMTSSAIEGESAKEEIPPISPIAKILVAIAGPAMNVVFAFAIASLIYYVGLPVEVNPSQIGYVEPGSAEANLGIQDGDTIIAVNNKQVNSWEEVNQATVLAWTNVLPVIVKHEGKTNTDTYMLKAEINGPLGVKTLNLGPRDLLIAKEITPGSPAEQAHVQLDDELINFAGVRISDFKQLTNLLAKCAGQPTPLIVKRGTKEVSLMVTPVAEVSTGKGRLGVRFGLPKDVYVLQHPTPMTQITEVFDNVKDTIGALVHSHSSGVKPSDLGGPVGIIEILAVKVKGDYRLALSFLVMLNINLAMINMLPIPVLDGGHIMMAIIESIRRKPIDVRIVEYTTTVFAVLLISFMLYITFFDIKRFPLIKALFNQETQIEQPAVLPANAAPSDPGK
jgi:regulator of sigma E protease